MKGYNRRWFIVSALCSLAGVGLIASLLGTEDMYNVEIVRGETTNYRKIGLSSGTDRYELSPDIEHWPIKCGDPSVCAETDPAYEYPMMCNCNTDKTIELVLNSGLWWANLCMIVVGGLCGIYAMGVSGYNAITKPTMEILSVRAVLCSNVSAIAFEFIGVILSVTIYFVSIKDDSREDSECLLPDFGGAANVWPSHEQGYKCENPNFGVSFWLLVTSIICFLLSIGSSFMAQRGFQSLDAEAEFGAETGDKKDDIMMF